MPKKFVFASVFLWLIVSSLSVAQTIQRLAHQSPDGAGICFQLTDGSVLCQGNGESDWYKLTPDITGSYVNGTWTQGSEFACRLRPGCIRFRRARRRPSCDHWRRIPE